MINTATLELNAATDVSFRRNEGATGEYATLLGIQNMYIGGDKHVKIPMNVLLQSNCVEYARSTALATGRRFLVTGRLSYSEQHKTYTLKADQLTVFPAGKSTKETSGQESQEPVAASSSPVPSTKSDKPTRNKK